MARRGVEFRGVPFAPPGEAFSLGNRRYRSDEFQSERTNVKHVLFDLLLEDARADPRRCSPAKSHMYTSAAPPMVLAFSNLREAGLP